MINPVNIKKCINMIQYTYVHTCININVENMKNKGETSKIIKLFLIFNNALV